MSKKIRSRGSRLHPSPIHGGRCRTVYLRGDDVSAGVAAGVIALGMAVGSTVYTPAQAETFSDAVVRQAQLLCQGFVEGSVSGSLPDNVCGAIQAGSNPNSTGIGVFTAPAAPEAVQERLRAARRSGAKGTGGASADVVDVGHGLSAFFSAGATQVDHHNNKYADGYDAQLPVATFGADYQAAPWATVGLAFTYSNFRGDYDDGGRFNTNSFGPIAYLSLRPVEGAFADLAVGYARKDYYRTRRGFIVNTNGSAGGQQRGGNSGNELNSSLLLGYDMPVANATVGPRFGLNYIGTQLEDYREHGDTGLELRYSNQDSSTLQSSLGAFGSMAISTRFGVVVPQVGAAWVHDYAIGGRTTDAVFVADPTGSKFTFKNERTPRDFATISLGVSSVLPNDIQPFITFNTIQGNDNFVSYGGTIGVRIGL